MSDRLCKRILKNVALLNNHYRVQYILELVYDFNLSLIKFWLKFCTALRLSFYDTLGSTLPNLPWMILLIPRI